MIFLMKFAIIEIWQPPVLMRVFSDYYEILALAYRNKLHLAQSLNVLFVIYYCFLYIQ